eukprot:12467120-Heterocapsa_arctica.AAC.1
MPQALAPGGGVFAGVRGSVWERRRVGWAPVEVVVVEAVLRPFSQAHGPVVRRRDVESRVDIIVHLVLAL